MTFSGWALRQSRAKNPLGIGSIAARRAVELWQIDQCVCVRACVSLEIGVKFNLSLRDAQAGPQRIPGSFFSPPKAPFQRTQTLTTI